LSSKKTKLLESAQKYFLKGQYDRAVSEYRQIIELDPHDLRHRQKVAEILTKANQKDEAVKEYTFLAKYYVDSVHYLKAIAVYKQIQKLDPANPETSLTLASLNEKQGLIGNATAEYATAVQIYESRGENLKALKALESIMSLDSGNSAVKLRVAEKYFTTGSEESSFNTFASLLADLKEKNDENGFNLIAERALMLFGEKAQEIISQTSEDDTVEDLQAELSQAGTPEIEITHDFSTETDTFSEESEDEIYEEIEYIEDILPIEDEEQNEQSSLPVPADEWEEEIDLISLDSGLQADAPQKTASDTFEELDIFPE